MSNKIKKMPYKIQYWVGSDLLNGYSTLEIIKSVGNIDFIQVIPPKNMINQNPINIKAHAIHCFVENPKHQCVTQNDDRNNVINDNVHHCKDEEKPEPGFESYNGYYADDED